MSTQQSRLATSLAGRYTIERELGQGGMATVYLALDVRHDRKVALKVLRPELSAVIGADRFLAEIKTTAGLQHPHILPLHDSGEVDGVVFYVMPYVEGETLRDRLQRDKQLPVDEAVRFAREVASALDYAHRHGVVHRDIKPENILVHDGQAVVADFGIALAVSRSDGGSRMTETGMSLGTPHYMAPEQAMGEREITPKADIYALGCVLYEMLTGDPPFTGSTAQAVVARSITEQPRSLVLQRRTIPPHIEAAVLTALEKLPADRFATAGEFATALEGGSYARRVAPPPATAAPAPVAPLRLRVAFFAVALLAPAAGFAWAMLRPAPSRPVTRFQMTMPPTQAPAPDRQIMVSPNGAFLVFVGGADTPGAQQLWVKPRDRDSATPLQGTANVVSFTISPDGNSIVFVQGTQIKKMALVGGAAITVGDSASPSRGIAWLDDHSIVYVNSSWHALRKIPDVGGPALDLWKSDTGFAWYPTALPGSKGVLFSVCRQSSCQTEMNLYAVSTSSRELHLVEPTIMRGEYVATGHVLLTRRDGAMLAKPFSARSLKTSGVAVPVLDSVALGLFLVPMFTVTSDGTLYVRSGASSAATALYEMVWVNRNGLETPVDSSFTFHSTVQGGNAGWALSPDGTRLAIGISTEAGDQVWAKQLPRGALQRVTFDSVQNYRPRWMRDGKSIMYVSRRTANAELHKRSADGTGSDSTVLKVAAPGIFEGAWSVDGKWLVVRSGGTQNQVGGRDISALRIGVDTVPKPLIATKEFDEYAIQMSPDGRWIAYESNETGHVEVFIRPFPNVDSGKWQASIGGGRAPLWTRNGRELFYVNNSRDMVVVSIADGPAPNPGTPKILFHMREELFLQDQENYTPFDISPDGQRFMMARRVRTTAVQVAPLIVTENWFQELRQRLAKQ